MSIVQEKMYMDVDDVCAILGVSSVCLQFDARVQQGVESKRLYCCSWKNLYQIFGRKDLRNEG